MVAYKRRWSRLDLLLALVPAAVAARVLGGNAAAVFLLAVGGIMPAAWLIGQSTAVLAARLSGSIDALLNATFGNLTELLVGVLLIIHAQVDVLKASITGGIVSNLLLVLGAAMLVGGYRRVEQQLHRRGATDQATMMVVAVATLLLPTVAGLGPQANGPRLVQISVVVAAVLIVLYAGSLVFTHRTHRRLFQTKRDSDTAREESTEKIRRWSVPGAIAVLAGSTVAAGVAAELIADSVEHAGPRLGLTTGFLGLVVIPVVGNAAEHFSAVTMAAGDRLDVAAGIAIGSSTQLIMFLVPLFVFVGLVTGHPVTLAVTPLELATLAASAILVHYLVSDGRGNVLEGGPAARALPGLRLRRVLHPAVRPGCPARQVTRPVRAPASWRGLSPSACRRPPHAWAPLRCRRTRHRPALTRTPKWTARRRCSRPRPRAPPAARR